MRRWPPLPSTVRRFTATVSSDVSPHTCHHNTHHKSHHNVRDSPNTSLFVLRPNGRCPILSGRMGYRTVNHQGRRRIGSTAIEFEMPCIIVWPSIVFLPLFASHPWDYGHNNDNYMRLRKYQVWSVRVFRLFRQKILLIWFQYNNSTRSRLLVRL